MDLVTSGEAWRAGLASSSAAYKRLSAALRRRLDACRAIRQEQTAQKRKRVQPDPPNLYWASGHVVGQQGASSDPWHPPPGSNGSPTPPAPPQGVPNSEPAGGSFGNGSGGG